MIRTVYGLYLFVLIFAPLAIGTVEQWSLTIMESAIFAALLSFFFIKKGKNLHLYAVPGMVPVILLLGWFLLQIVPLPPGVVGFVSPSTYNLYSETVGVDRPLSWISLAINRKAAITEFFRISSYCAFYFITVQLLSDRVYLKKTVQLVIIFASLYSLFSIVQHLTSNNKIFWFRELSQGGTPFGSYVNRNHYAGLMEMLFPVAIGIFLYYKPRISYGSFLERLRELGRGTHVNTYILIGFSSILIGLSIFLTLSRGAIVSLSFSIIFFGAMVAYRQNDRKRGTLIVTVAIIILFSVGWFGWEPIFERFGKIRDAEGNISDLRVAIWKDTFNIIQDFPVAGVGGGSFVNIYPAYRTAKGELIVDHAHNDYLELAAEGGLLGLFIAISVIVSVVVKTFRVFRLRRDKYSIYLYLGSLTGLLSILIHSITDFNLYIGANGLYFWFLLGLAVTASNTKFEGAKDTLLGKLRCPSPAILKFTAAFTLFVSLCFNMSVLMGNFYYSYAEGVNINGDDKKGLELARDLTSKAYKVDPLEGQYPYTLSTVAMLENDLGRALLYSGKALANDPANSAFLQRKGKLTSLKEGNELLSERLFKSAIKYDISNPERYKAYASWLLSGKRRDEAARYFNKAIAREPQNVRAYVTHLKLGGFSDEAILNILPERVEAYLSFGDYLGEKRALNEAKSVYMNALKYVEGEEVIKASFFYRPCSFFLSAGDIDKALIVMRKAIKTMPDNEHIRLKAADLFEKAGLTYRAVEEYKSALLINPDNRIARNKMKKLIGD